MLKKTIHRPNHRERAQPLEREKWGVLEKHKDYSLRARVFKEKKARLQILRQKATERNPDEFSYGMLSSKSKSGRKLTDRGGNAVLSQDAAKLLKTQDSGYLRTMLQKTRRALEKLEQEFVLRDGQGVEMFGGLDDQVDAQHVVFVESREEQKEYAMGKASASQEIPSPQEEYDEKSAEEIATSMPKTSRAAKKQEAAMKQDKLVRKQHKKEQDARKSKLAALKVREKDLKDAGNELELQRAKMNNNVGGVTKAGVKWKTRERKT